MRFCSKKAFPAVCSDLKPNRQRFTSGSHSRYLAWLDLHRVRKNTETASSLALLLMGLEEKGSQQAAFFNF